MRTPLIRLSVLLALDASSHHSAYFRCRFDHDNSILYVPPMSKIHIVCPNPTTIMKKVKANTSRDKLYQNLWIVSRESYQRCNTDYTQGSRLLLRCITPLTLKYYTLVFQRYSALSSQVFIPGKEYYFIGMYVTIKRLSSPSSLPNLIGVVSQLFSIIYWRSAWRPVLIWYYFHGGSRRNNEKSRLHKKGKIYGNDLNRLCVTNQETLLFGYFLDYLHL